MGEPSGIGPEVAVKAWAALGGTLKGRPLRLIGDRKTFRAAALTAGADPAAFEQAIVETGHPTQAQPGKPSPENAAAVTEAIAEGVRMIEAGTAAALVTAPIQKSVLSAAGFAYPGHTEYLAALTGAKRAVMMLASHGLAPPLRAVPLTVHIALREVPQAISKDAIVAISETVLAALAHDFAIEKPRLAIAGLNPHAGEDGTMGSEDREAIAPAAAELAARGHEVRGPLPADTLFHAAARRTYDAVICMYHDQALIPIKTLAFWTGVNATLGLPIVRTSPDHGTALDIAGRGVAEAKSTIAAIEMAAEIAERRGL